MPRVLVAYATKLGSTQEIAGVIGEVLRAGGHQVDVRSVRDVRSLTPYRAVVLGSALYAAHWQKTARAFASAHRDALRALPLWLFSTGPLDTTQAALNLPMTPHAAEIAEPLGAREHRTFGGRLEADAPLEPSVMVHHRVGDFRNWEDIRAWAAGIAAALHSEAVSDE